MDKQLERAIEPSRDLARISPRDSGMYYPRVAPEAAAPGQSGILLDYLRIIRRHTLSLLIASVLGALAGFGLTRLQMPVYQATASLEIQPRNENPLNMPDMNPAGSSPSYAPEYDIQTVANLLQSKTVIRRALGRMGFPGRALPAEIRPAPGEQDQDLALAAARRNLRIRAKLNSRLLDIRYDSTDARYAADFVNALTAEYIDANVRTRWESAKRTSEWLSGQMAGMKARLEESQQRLQAYVKDAGIAVTSDKDNIAEQKLRQVQDELSRAHADRVTKQSKHEAALAAPLEAVPEVLDDVGLREYQSKLAGLRAQLANLSSLFTPAYPKITKLKAEIAAIESARDKARENIVARLRNESDAARRREQLLAADYGRQWQLVSSQSAALIRYNTLKGEVDAERELYETLVRRVREAEVASALRASDVHVVDAGEAPKRPYKPDVILNTGLGFFSGVLLGIGYAVIRGRSDRSIREPGDTALYLDTSVLGVIPSARLERDGKRSPTVSLSGVLSSAALAPANPEVMFWNGGPSAIAESFRATLTSILLSGPSAEHPRVVVLTSANPGEGKSLVASNLAIALAKANMRVALVDGDLRRPRLHDIFGIENSSGFSEGLNFMSDDFRDLSLVETAFPRLHVLTRGGCDDTNLLYSRRLPELIAHLRHRFEMVLIDTPPMLHMPDARIIARHADAVILVVRARKTTWEAACMARQRLLEDGTTILGTILNDWEPKNMSSYGYDKYYGRYHDKT